MTTYDNTPPLDGWQIDPHGCPFELTDCPTCKGRIPYQLDTDQHIERGTN